MHGQDSRMHGLIILLRGSRSEMIPSASLRKLRLPNLIKTLLLHMNAILSKLGLCLDAKSEDEKYCSTFRLYVVNIVLLWAN